MKMGIIVRGIALTESIRHYANRRLSSALGRFEQAVQWVRISLADVNGPGGGIDKHCVIEVRAPELSPIVIRERNADLYAAIDRAACRVDHALARRLARNRMHDSRSLRRLAWVE